MIACVWVGDKYGLEYVERLRNMVIRHSDVTTLYCLTDKPQTQLENVIMVDISHHGLTGWWAKMALFEKSWRKEPVLYFDLDTVITDNIQPLYDYAQAADFSICGNFTRMAGNTGWPCKYGSCVMTIPADDMGWLWSEFKLRQTELIKHCGRYGDQMAIEILEPDALILQDELPGMFMGYREFTESKPVAPVAIFAGNNKPDNSPFQWVSEAWA